jgi:hypothetical protein
MSKSRVTHADPTNNTADTSFAFGANEPPAPEAVKRPQASRPRASRTPSTRPPTA